jgi:hypothetical protein
VIREKPKTPYTRQSYETILATKGSFMGKFDSGVIEASRELYQTLLEAEQPVPQDTLFRDDLFSGTCDAVRGRNEAMVVRDISPLICPYPQLLRIGGGKHLKLLNESVNEGWNCAEPFYGPQQVYPLRLKEFWPITFQNSSIYPNLHVNFQRAVQCPCTCTR